jgi:NADH dehydrogenase [ubiquinone] 1 alpha subcomplex assembly factor 6
MDLTSQAITAQGRFLFWDQVIDSIFASKGKAALRPGTQPVAFEIQENYLLSREKLSKRWLKRLIEGRNSPVMMTNLPFKSIREMEDYSDSILSPAYYLTIEFALNFKEGTDSTRSSSPLQLKLDHIASHMGKAQGLSNMLRGVRHNAKQGRCYLGSDLLLKHKVSQEDILRGKQTQPVKDVAFDVATVAHHHLEHGVTLLKDPDVKQWVPLFLPLLPVQIYLERLQRMDFDLFHESLGRRDNNLPLKLWWKSLKLKLFNK